MDPKDDQSDDLEKNIQDATRQTSAFARYSSIGFQMLGTIGLGVWGGLKLDEWQGNENPIWTIVLSLLAIGGSLYLFIKGLPKQS
jgi:hypothetical protein